MFAAGKVKGQTPRVQKSSEKKKKSSRLKFKERFEEQDEEDEQEDEIDLGQEIPKKKDPEKVIKQMEKDINEWERQRQNRLEQKHVKLLRKEELAKFKLEQNEKELQQEERYLNLDVLHFFDTFFFIRNSRNRQSSFTEEDSKQVYPEVEQIQKEVAYLQAVLLLWENSVLPYKVGIFSYLPYANTNELRNVVKGITLDDRIANAWTWLIIENSESMAVVGLFFKHLSYLVTQTEYRKIVVGHLPWKALLSFLQQISCIIQQKDDIALQTFCYAFEFLANLFYFETSHPSNLLKVIYDCLQETIKEETPRQEELICGLLRCLANLTIDESTICDEFVSLGFVNKTLPLLLSKVEEKKNDFIWRSCRELTRLLSHLTISSSFVTSIIKFLPQLAQQLFSLDHRIICWYSSLFWLGMSVDDELFDLCQIENEDMLQTVLSKIEQACDALDELEWMEQFGNPLDYVDFHYEKVQRNETMTFPTKSYSRTVVHRAVRYGKCHKPVIYLYSNTSHQVVVNVKHDNSQGYFTELLPTPCSRCEEEKFSSVEWNVTLVPNTNQLQIRDQLFSYIYWESHIIDRPTRKYFTNCAQATNAYIVAKKDLYSFFTWQLQYFTVEERQDFVEYWIPMMNTSEYFHIQFLVDDPIFCNMAPLSVQSQSVTTIIMNRILMVFSSCNNTVSNTTIWSSNTCQPPVFHSRYSQLDNEIYVFEWGGIELL